MAVGHIDVAGAVAGRHRALGGLDVAFCHAGPRHRHGQNDDLIAHVGGHLEGWRRRVVARDGKHQAVRQLAARRAECHTAQQQRGVVKLQGVEAPGPGHRRCKAAIELAARKTILLLEMLRLEEHALSPHHLVVPSHLMGLYCWVVRDAQGLLSAALPQRRPVGLCMTAERYTRPKRPSRSQSRLAASPTLGMLGTRIAAV